MHRTQIYLQDEVYEQLRSRSQAQGLNPEQLKYTIRLYLYRLLSKRKTKC